MKSPLSSHENSIGQRLKLEMKTRGMSSARLADMAGVKTSFLYDIISGKSSNPSPAKLARVAESLGVDLAWLIGGNAPTGKHSQGDYVTIPRIMVDASAGGGTLVSVEQEGESYYFRKQWIKEHLGTHEKDLRMLYVRGDSMEPTLSNNDIILVDTTKKNPSPPGIFVLFEGFGLVAKRLEFSPGKEPVHVRIISDNPQYSTYERSAAETAIIGRVVWFAREM